jgi:hypothetical protein
LENASLGAGISTCKISFLKLKLSKFKYILVSSSQKQHRKSIQTIQNFIAYLSALNSQEKTWDYFSAAIMDIHHGGTQGCI